jgi:hypothetical protein
MKVKYLGIMFAASLLSLGLMTSCAAPDAGEAPAGDDATEVAPEAGTEPTTEPAEQP